MAELLVRATGHYLDKLSKEEVDKMTSEQKQSYEARSQKGDVICVFPDGACKEKPAPNTPFVIIKVPKIDLKYLENTLNKEKIVTREYSIKQAEWDDSAKKESFLTSIKSQKTPTVIESKDGICKFSTDVKEDYLAKLRKYKVDESVVGSAIENKGVLELKEINDLKLITKDS
jgi:hypothetical protein